MSDALKQLFDSKHGIRLEQVKKLDQADVEALAAMADETEPAPRRVDVALSALSFVAPSRALERARRLVEAVKASGDVRSVAAHYLAWLDPGGAEDVLIRSLEGAAPEGFRLKVAQMLGRVGTPKSFAALAALATSNDEATRRVSRFGLILVSLRARLDSYLPSDPPPQALLRFNPAALKDVPFGDASAEQVKQVLSHLSRDPFGIKLQPDAGVQWECAGTMFILLTNAAIVVDDPVRDMLAKPAIMGLIAERAPVDGSYSTRYVMVSWPVSTTEVKLAGYRTDGRQAFFGIGKKADTQAHFLLNSVKDGAAAPLEIVGSFRGKRIGFDRVRSDDRVTGRQLPRAGIIFR